MKNNTLKEQAYEAPTIECIELDNEISLVLTSDDLPPTYENNSVQCPDFLKQQPFKTYQG